MEERKKDQTVEIGKKNHKYKLNVTYRCLISIPKTNIMHQNKYHAYSPSM